MSYNNFQYPFLPTGSDARPEFPMSINQFEQHQPPYKKPKTSQDFNQCTSSTMPQANRGTSNNIFYKTRMCTKFKHGTCRNGENCNFAHGIQDKRQPPPNWQRHVQTHGDPQIIHQMKLCKKVYNGEECPYGDRCNFLHVDATKFRHNSGTRMQESVGGFLGAGTNHGSSNAFVYRKTKLCNKWEMTSYCPYGDQCRFAHGETELQVPGGYSRVEAENASSISPDPVTANNESPSLSENVSSVIEEEQGMNCLSRWNGKKKIIKIYGDWIDDDLA